MNVSLVVYNNEGCFDSTSSPIVIYPNVDALFTSDSIGCSPLNIHFQNQSSGSITFNWNFGDGTLSSQTNPDHIFSNNTLNDVNYTIKLITSSIFGCSDSITKTLLFILNLVLY